MDNLHPGKAIFDLAEREGLGEQRVWLGPDRAEITRIFNDRCERIALIARAEHPAVTPSDAIGKVERSAGRHVARNGLQPQTEAPQEAEQLAA